MLIKALESDPETILFIDKDMTIAKVIPNNKETAITEEAENHKIDSISGIRYPAIPPFYSALPALIHVIK